MNSKDIFEVSYCKSKAGYCTNPKISMKLDLDKIKKSFKTVVDTPILLVVEQNDKNEGDEIIIHNYGKIIFKKTKDKDKIEKIAAKIYDIGLKK